MAIKKKANLSAVLYNRLVNKHCFIVGVDVSKSQNTAYYTSNQVEIEGKIRFANYSQGFKKFLDHIRTKARQIGAEQIIVALEPTGSYSLPLIYFLDRQPDILMVGVNPVLIKRFRQLPDNSPEKSDDKDPILLTQIVGLRSVITVRAPKGHHHKLRQWVRARFQTVDDRTALLNQLHAVVALVFPELLMLFSTLKRQTVLALLQHYPTPADILRLGVEELAAFLHRHSRGQLGQKRAQALVEAAKESAGLEDCEGYVAYIHSLVQRIQTLNQLIEEYEQQIDELLAELPLAQFLLSVPGVGPIVAATLLAEFDGFQNFRYTDQVMKFAGLNLCRRQSGKYVGEIKISKWGSAFVRRALFLAVTGMVAPGGLFYQQYQAYLRRGKQKKQALVALMRKLLRILFALARDRAYFDPTRLWKHELRLAA